jgi:hypothetical protein
MKITNKSLLRPVNDERGELEELNKYTAKDRKYTIAAITVTTSKFGPSGSLKKKNIAREKIIAVIPNIINEVFFDLKYISIMILRI